MILAFMQIAQNASIIDAQLAGKGMATQEGRTGEGGREGVDATRTPFAEWVRWSGD